MMWGGGGGFQTGTRVLSLTSLILLTWNKGQTREDPGSLNLTTEGLIIFDTGNGPMNPRANFHD